MVKVHVRGGLGMMGLARDQIMFLAQYIYKKRNEKISGTDEIRESDRDREREESE